MANAKKCDICGGYYELYNTSKNESKPNGFMFVNTDSKGKYWDHPIHDCCPTCIESIREHIESLGEITIELNTEVVEKRCNTCKFNYNRDTEYPCNECWQGDRVTYEFWQPKE